MIERATIYRDGDRKWHWRFSSRGGTPLGENARHSGFVDKRNAIHSLEVVAGGPVALTSRWFAPDGLHQQGWLTRLVQPGDPRLEPYEQKIFVEVLP